MLAPQALLAAERSPADNYASAATQVAYLDLPDSATLPEPDKDGLAEEALQSLADEASKQAQTKYLAAKWRKSPNTVRKYVNLAWAEADKREGLEPELIIAILQKESALRPNVQSSYGAQGLMQVVRRWHRDKVQPSESLFDPAVNIRVGAHILEEYLDQADGNLSKALAKYSGNARGYATTVMKESRKLARVAEHAAATVAAAQSAAASG
ncbi:transglycosylase SLT domain-containing protein [Pusillimonas sp. TS35]|nr:transglycosylase SLT domain-containing protein [Pusillimonas sp. TS35]